MFFFYLQENWQLNTITGINVKVFIGTFNKNWVVELLTTIGYSTYVVEYAK